MDKLFFLVFVFLLSVPGGRAVAELTAEPAESIEEQDGAFSSSVKQFLEKEELRVQDTFPQYRSHFNHKQAQEEVYKEFLKQLKEKEKSSSSD